MTLGALGTFLIAVPLGLFAYAYVVYPAILRLIAGIRPRAAASETRDQETWPSISIALAAYNEEASIRETIQSLLALEYPADRLQVVVASDASTDGTDGIVEEFAQRGVRLVRLERRGGKVAAEMAATSHLTGEVVVKQ